MAKRPYSDAPGLWLVILPSSVLCRGHVFRMLSVLKPLFHVWLKSQLIVTGQKSPDWSPFVGAVPGDSLLDMQLSRRRKMTQMYEQH